MVVKYQERGTGRSDRVCIEPLLDPTGPTRRSDTAMNIDDFRKLALSLPEATESAHMGHPDFRVRGKIFATIWPAEGWGMVKLTPNQQVVFVEGESAVFVPVKGGWGRKGATNVRLESADTTTVRKALVTAWCNVAPKKLAEEHGLCCWPLRDGKGGPS